MPPLSAPFIVREPPVMSIVRSPIPEWEPRMPSLSAPIAEREPPVMTMRMPPVPW